MNTGGAPTPDEPGTSLSAPQPRDAVSGFLDVRVADIAASYADAIAERARFPTEPLDRRAELRCHLRDPDGYLIEVGQATGIPEGILADRPASATEDGRNRCAPTM